MSHATGEAPNGFQLLGLVQLFLEVRVFLLHQFPFRDVLEHPQHRAGHALGIEDGHLGDIQPDGTPFAKINIVIKAILNGRTDTEFYSRVEFFQCFGHDAKIDKRASERRF